jgi:hypothetical protein
MTAMMVSNPFQNSAKQFVDRGAVWATQLRRKLQKHHKKSRRSVIIRSVGRIYVQEFKSRIDLEHVLGVMAEFP